MLLILSSCPFLGLIHSCFCTPDLDSSIKSSSKRQTINLGAKSRIILTLNSENKNLAPEKPNILLERVPKYTAFVHMNE